MASRTLSSTAILSAGPVPDLMDIKQESRPAAIGLTPGIAVLHGDRDNLEE
jgi:hypothetical protein